MSGYEPSYNPDKWSDPIVEGSHNCYTYFLNDQIPEVKNKCRKLCKKKNKCREVETKIVKIYLNLRELEEDNYKNLTVDKHYLIGDPSNPINKVKPGDYCILKHPDNPSQDVDKIDMTDKNT